MKPDKDCPRCNGTGWATYLGVHGVTSCSCTSQSVEMIDATINNWILSPLCKNIEGFIADDAKGRWKDGTFFHTSSIPNLTISEYLNLKEGDIVKTLNSVYLLGRKSG